MTIERSGRQQSGTRTALWLFVVILTAMSTWLWARQGATRPESSSERPGAVEHHVSIRLRELRDAVVARGTVGADEVVAVDRAAFGADGASLVVTATPLSRGDVVAAGEAILEVAGRPVLVLSGAVPAYRDLVPGVTGPDVVQLQRALRQLGIPVEDPDGTYGASTGAAVTELYSRAGYRAPEPPDGVIEEARSSEAAVRAAQQVVDTLQRGPAADALVEARVSAGASQRLLADAEANAADDVAVAKARVDTARAEMADSAVDSRASAAMALIEAEAQLKSTMRSSAASIASAKDQMIVAQARLESLLGGPDNDEMVSAVEELNSAKVRRDEAALAAVTPLPRAQIMFLNEFPSRVTAMDVSVGDLIDGDHVGIEVSRGSIGVVVELTPEAGHLVHKGMAVSVEDARSGVSFTATVDSEPASTRAGDSVEIFVMPDSPISPDLVGTDVKVTIQLAATAGRVLAAPITAVTTGADGTSRVELVTPDGTTKDVRVRTGVMIDGWVELVDPPQELKDGTKIRVV